jgi:prepilin-type N-terminal cleavage/methylation domain-containing protein
MDTNSTIKNRGFSLVEILIAVAIIAVIVTIAIPNMLSYRIRANENAAIQRLGAIHLALDMYHKSYNIYPANISFLTNANPPFLVDPKIEFLGEPGSMAFFNCEGYGYAYLAAGANVYGLGAGPLKPGVTGNRVFKIEEDGAIYVLKDGSWEPLY